MTVFEWPLINASDILLQLTGDATYEPNVLFKQSYLLHGVITFGKRNETTTTLLQNPTEINFEFFADILPTAKHAYDNLPDTKHCPREVLKFRPPPQNERCDQSVYRDLTTLHEYGLNISFHNVSSNLLFFLCLSTEMKHFCLPPLSLSLNRVSFRIQSGSKML